MIAVGGDLEPAPALGAYAVQHHELLNTLLAQADASGQQFFPGVRPAAAAAGLGMDGLDVHQQRVVAQVAPLRSTCLAHEVFVVPGHAHLQHPALHRERPFTPVTLDEGVLHFAAFAKYAVAFPRMSRSIFTRASSARSRLISICLALTALLSTPVSLPVRWALTQLNNVWATFKGHPGHVGHCVARVVALISALQAGDHPTLAFPCVLGGVEEFVYLALLMARALVFVLQGEFGELRNLFEHRVARQSHDVMHVGALAEIEDGLPAKARVGAKDDTHLGPLLTQSPDQQPQDRGSVFGPVNAAWAEVRAQQLLTAKDIQRQQS